MPGIFVSYRRDDAAGHAGRLIDRLRGEFGRDRVFADVDSIRLGGDFRKALAQAIANCDVAIVVVGKLWLDCRDGKGSRRLDDPDDWVRFEISEALKRDLPVVPVLVQGAAVPAVESLPDDLKPLATRQATQLIDSQWDATVSDLVHRLTLLPELRVRVRARRKPPVWLALLGAIALIGLIVLLLWSREESGLSTRGEQASPVVRPIGCTGPATYDPVDLKPYVNHPLDWMLRPPVGNARAQSNDVPFSFESSSAVISLRSVSNPSGPSTVTIEAGGRRACAAHLVVTGNWSELSAGFNVGSLTFTYQDDSTHQVALVNGLTLREGWLYREQDTLEVVTSPQNGVRWGPGWKEQQLRAGRQAYGFLDVLSVDLDSGRRLTKITVETKIESSVSISAVTLQLPVAVSS